MGEVFRGWKRKVGMLTLILAGMAMAGWVRSVSDGDVLLMKISDEFFTLRSTNSRLQLHHDWRKFTLDGQPIIGPTNGQIHQNVTDFLDQSPWRQTYAQFSRRNSFYELGENSNSFERKGPYPTQVWISLPYWSIVLPLVFVSAWLLVIYKRRPSKVKYLYL